MADARPWAEQWVPHSCAAFSRMGGVSPIYNLLQTLMPSSLKRYQTDGHYHFLTFSCYRRLPKLNDDRTRIVFEEMLEAVRRRHRFFVFGYVLMPEHVHLLLTEPTVYPLATSISVLKGETAKILKDGPLPFWQVRYYDFNVFTQVKFAEKLRYIHRNPVERGLVEKPEEWPWSSFRHWAQGEMGRVEIESHWTWDRRERELVDGGRTSGSAIPPMRNERA